MEIKESVIYLDKEQNTYNPGETVNGKIKYLFNAPIEIKAIRVVFVGSAHTEFIGSEIVQRFGIKKKPIRRNSLHTGDEDYINVCFNILDSNEDHSTHLLPGEQVYNFKYTLPELIPSSFEGKLGYVRYYVKVALYKSLDLKKEEKPYHVTQCPFTVVRGLDTAHDSCCTEALHIQMEKTFECLSCCSRPLIVDVRVPASGFCANQIIPLEVDVQNFSNVNVKFIQISLRKIVSYKTDCPKNYYRISEEVIESVQTGPVPKRTTKHWDLNIEVPSIPPSKLRHCNYITLDYDLHVIIVLMLYTPQTVYFNPLSNRVKVECMVRCRSNPQEQKPIMIACAKMTCHCKKVSSSLNPKQETKSVMTELPSTVQEQI